MIDVYPAYTDNGIRVQFFGDEIEKIQSFDVISGNVTSSFDQLIFILPIYLLPLKKL